MSGIERRRFTRFEFHQEMRLYMLESRDPVSGLDISREGIGFAWHEPLEAGTDFEVLLCFGDTLQMRVMLSVVFCRQADEGYTIGSLMQSEDAELLEKLVVAMNEEREAQ